jgi:hypothetical protein
MNERMCSVDGNWVTKRRELRIIPLFTVVWYEKERRIFRLRNSIHQIVPDSQGSQVPRADSRGTHGSIFLSDRIDLNTKNVEEDLFYRVEFVSFFYHN